jgi:hypothetical protein
MIGRIHGRDDNDRWTVDLVCLSELSTRRQSKMEVPLTATAMSFPFSSNLKTRDNKGLEKSTEGTYTICDLRQTLGNETGAKGEPHRPRWTAQNVRTQAV